MGRGEAAGGDEDEPGGGGGADAGGAPVEALVGRLDGGAALGSAGAAVGRSMIGRAVAAGAASASTASVAAAILRGWVVGLMRASFESVVIVAAEEPERIGRRALSLAVRIRIFGSASASPIGAILAVMEARATEVFVGRRRELGELERALEQARAGSGLTVLLAGEAGIGKTRLASELARRARADGLRGPARAFDRSRRHRAARTSRSSRRCVRSESFGGRRAGRGLAATGVRGDARAAHRARGRRARAARAGGSALGGYVDARPGRLPRPQPPRPARSPARDLSRRRPHLGRADASIRRRRPALGLGDPARARAARARRPGGAAGGPRRRPGAGRR